MNCDRASEHLQEVIDGADASPALQAHLQRCAICQQEERRLRAVKAQLSALPDHIEPPARLWQQIEAAVDAKSTTTAPFAERAGRARRGGVMLRWTAAAAVVAGVSMIGYNLQGTPDLPQGYTTSGPFAVQEAAALEWVCAGAQTILKAQLGDEAPSAAVAGLLAEIRRVDTAIGETRQQLGSDDSSAPRVDHLARLCRVKLRLLSQAASMSRT